MNIKEYFQKNKNKKKDSDLFHLAINPLRKQDSKVNHSREIELLRETSKSLNNAVDALIARNRSLEEELYNIKNRKVNKDAIDLNEKVDAFIDWYKKVMVKEYDSVYMVSDLRNFIEKMAVWYELRYPDYEINRLMHCAGQEPTIVSDIMFKENRYTVAILDKENEIKDLDWDDFYNAHAFIGALPSKERCYFYTPKYRDLKCRDYDLELTNNGIIKSIKLKSSVVSLLSEKEASTIPEFFVGKPVEELLYFLKLRFPSSKIYQNLEADVKKYEDRLYQKEEMLNSVMYRIIERGGNRLGPRRAFLFAKEFGRNIDIPIMYAIDYSDPGLRTLINEYLKAGGSPDLECFVDYFGRHKYKQIKTVTIGELLQTQSHNAIRFYTPEEDELHKRILTILKGQINQEELQKERVQQLRLERKLEKSRKNGN